jgi:plastocyanin
MMRFRTLMLLAATSVLAGACSSDRQEGNEAPSAGAPAAASAPAGPITPDPGGKVIVVEMETDAQGNNVFRPASIEARKGDVIRYTLVAGVHNAHFLPDSNPTLKGLPHEEPLLQLPGQTHDVKVTFEPGTYYFHCDPHSLLGMKGHLTVVP